MVLQPTTIPGFSKDPDTGMLINTDKAKIDMTKAARAQHKNLRNIETRLDEIERRLNEWEEKLKKYD